MAVLLSGAGASTAGAFTGAALVEIARRTKFEYFCGVSYSAIIGVPLALGMYNTIIDKTNNLTHKDFFKVPPMDAAGRFTFKAHLRALASIFAPNRFKSFGVQDVRPLLKRFITPQLFRTYQNGNFPVVYICAVNADTQEPQIWNVKNKSITYDKYLDIVAASARIPVWTQPQIIDGAEYYDGGVTDTNAAGLVLLMNNDIKKVFSVYSRPKGFKGKLVPERRGIVGAINWTIDTMLKDVSRNDERNERALCKNKNIDLVQIFPSKYILTNLYSVQRSHLLELSKMGTDAARAALNKKR